MASQKPPSVLPRSRLGFVVVTGTAEAEVMLGHLAFEGTKQIRPNAVMPFRSVAAHFVLCGQGYR